MFRFTPSLFDYPLNYSVSEPDGLTLWEKTLPELCSWPYCHDSESTCYKQLIIIWNVYERRCLGSHSRVSSSAQTTSENSLRFCFHGECCALRSGSKVDSLHGEGFVHVYSNNLPLKWGFWASELSKFDFFLETLVSCKERHKIVCILCLFLRRAEIWKNCSNFESSDAQTSTSKPNYCCK